MSFDVWWSKNRELYTLAGVSESAARCIWNEATYFAEQPIRNEVQKLIKTLQNET